MAGRFSAWHTARSCSRPGALALLLVLGVLSVPARAQEAPPPPKPHGPALFSEPGFMTSALDWAGRTLGDGSDEAKTDGFYPNIGNMITGAGWLAVGPGYRTHVFGDHAIVDASAAISWRGYLTANASFELPLLADGRLAVGSEGLWQDLMQVNYFGLGPDSSLDLRSQYRLQTLNVVGYARYRPQRWLAIGGRFGWLDGVSVQSATGWFNRDYLDAQTIFPDDPGMTIPDNPDFLHGEVSIAADTRDYPRHPTSGALYRASAGVYADRGLDAFSFRRYEVEGLQVVPLFGDAWILAFRGWGVFSDPSSGHEVPFYMAPSLGGANTLRGFPNYRFHDRHLLLGSAESRWPLFQHIDAAVFIDSGTVAARVRDLGFDKTAYGFGFRVHSHTATTARIDVAHSTEGWQMLFRLNDPFALSRLKRWTAAVPFVP